MVTISFHGKTVTTTLYMNLAHISGLIVNFGYNMQHNHLTGLKIVSIVFMTKRAIRLILIII